MLFRKPDKAAPPLTGAAALREVVRAHLAQDEEDALGLVVAVAGLLAAVAYVDRDYDEADQANVRTALSAMRGLNPRGVDAICAVLREHVRDIASINPQAFTRALREDGTIELRREVLDVLLDLAAADDVLSLDETNLLRRTATALGLSPDDYVVSQSRHRDKLRL